ncbi:Uncharacterized protein APZ42_004455 [Daphnia magna]|uniref:Uncharacterized protein n=1 Tax=Daphnia magna TaxID=35525 RepID=A0A164H1N7_9CRUS|nr:Uncharacterized protein APZ42_004455 [Daphnia magna]
MVVFTINPGMILFSIWMATEFPLNPPLNSWDSDPKLSQTLVLLHKSLVRSLMDYGAIAYGSASKTNLERVDVVGRAILRNILGAKRSNPVEILYAETGMESLSWRTKLLTRKYPINLSHKPNNPIHKPFVQLATTTTQWKPRSTPGLIKELDFV